MQLTASQLMRLQTASTRDLTWRFDGGGGSANVIYRLVAMGLLTWRDSHDGDYRNSKLSITEQGRAALDRPAHTQRPTRRGT